MVWYNEEYVETVGLVFVHPQIDAFRKQIEGREKSEEELQSIREWKTAMNVEGLRTTVIRLVSRFFLQVSLDILRTRHGERQSRRAEIFSGRILMWSCR